MGLPRHRLQHTMFLSHILPPSVSMKHCSFKINASALPGRLLQWDGLLPYIKMHCRKSAIHRFGKVHDYTK